MWHHRQQQVDVRAPSVAFDNRFLGGGAHRIPNDRHPEQPEGAEGIVDAGYACKSARQPASNPLQLANRLRHVVVDGGLADDNVCAAFESLHEFRDLVRPVSQVALHQDDSITTRVPAALQCSAE